MWGGKIPQPKTEALNVSSLTIDGGPKTVTAAMDDTFPKISEVEKAHLNACPSEKLHPRWNLSLCRMLVVGVRNADA